MASLLTELKRRNVFRVAAAYAAVAWLSLELLSIVLPEFGAPAWALRALIIVLVVGFIPALIFAWAFEVTPDGIKPEKHVDRSEPALQQSARKLDQVVIVLVIAAIGVLVLDRFVLDPRQDSAKVAAATGDEINSIAVLPFEDFSAGGDHAYLGTGIADTILHSLAQIDGLKVAARTSSFQLAEQKADIAAIGVALGVGAVLEGSVQVVGNQLRIIAQLVRTSDQSHLWSKTFSGTTDDIFATQDTIAAAVAETLKGRGSAAPAPQDSTEPEVYALFLKGRELWQRRNPSDLEEAVSALERAVELDPDYLPARAELIAALWFSHLYGDLDGEVARERVDTGIKTVLEKDPTHAQTWSIRGLRRQSEGQSEEAIAAFERSLELNPNDARVMVWLAQELEMAGAYNDSRQWIERAFERDPMNTYVRGRFASALAQTAERAARRRAMAIVEETLRLDPAAYRAYEDAIAVTSQAGDLVQAVRYGVRAFELRPATPNVYSQFVLLFTLLGDPDTAVRWGEALQARFGEWPGSDWRLITGDIDGFVEWARRLRAENPEHAMVRGNYAYAMLMTDQDEAGEIAEQFVEDEGLLRDDHRPTISDMNILSLLAWWHNQRGNDERVAELREHISAMYARIEANGRPAGINGTLMEIGYWIVMGNGDRAYDSLAALDGTNDAYFYTVWEKFPSMQSFTQREDVQALLEKWAGEQATLRGRLRENAPEWLYEPSRLETNQGS